MSDLPLRQELLLKQIVISAYHLLMAEEADDLPVQGLSRGWRFRMQEGGVLEITLDK